MKKCKINVVVFLVVVASLCFLSSGVFAQVALPEPGEMIPVEEPTTNFIVGYQKSNQIVSTVYRANLDVEKNEIRGIDPVYSVSDPNVSLQNHMKVSNSEPGFAIGVHDRNRGNLKVEYIKLKGNDVASKVTESVFNTQGDLIEVSLVEQEFAPLVIGAAWREMVFPKNYITLATKQGTKWVYKDIFVSQSRPIEKGFDCIWMGNNTIKVLFNLKLSSTSIPASLYEILVSDIDQPPSMWKISNPKLVSGKKLSTHSFRIDLHTKIKTGFRSMVFHAPIPNSLEKAVYYRLYDFSKNDWGILTKFSNSLYSSQFMFFDSSEIGSPITILAQEHSNLAPFTLLKLFYIDPLTKKTIEVEVSKKSSFDSGSLPSIVQPDQLTTSVTYVNLNKSELMVTSFPPGSLKVRADLIVDRSSNGEFFQFVDGELYRK